MKTLLALALSLFSLNAFANDSTPPTFNEGLYATNAHYCAIRLYRSTDGQTLTSMAAGNPVYGNGCDDGGHVTSYEWASVRKNNGDVVWAYEQKCTNDTAHWCSIIEFVNDDTLVQTTSSNSIGYFRY